MGPHLADTPVRRQRLQPQVLGAQLEPAGQLDRAHHGVDGQLDAEELGLGGQEGVVEADIVGDQGASTQHVDQLTDDVAETRLIGQHLGGQAVHVGGTGIDAGVEQGGDAAFDVAVVAERQGREADDARLAWSEAGRLDIDDDPARAWFGSRPAPGLAHTVRMARRPDNARSTTQRVVPLKCREWSPPVDVSHWRPERPRGGRRGSPAVAPAR